MKAVVVNYRGSHKQRNTKQIIAKVVGIDSKKDTDKIIGKHIIWTSPAGRRIEGKITQAHGSKGAVRVLFSDKGLPGQALGQEVEVE